MNDSFEQLLQLQRSMTRINEFADPLRGFRESLLEAARPFGAIQEQLAQVKLSAELQQQFKAIRPILEMQQHIQAGLLPVLEAVRVVQEQLRGSQLIADVFKANRVFHELVRASLGPSMAIMAALETREVATLTVDREDAIGLMTWIGGAATEPRANEPVLKLAAVTPWPKARDQAENRKLNVTVDLKCLRCGKPLFSTGDYAVTSAEDVFLDLAIVPWCRCMSEWDGTPEDLVRRGMTPTLRLVGGAAEGNGEPRAVLKLVECDGDSDQE